MDGLEEKKDMAGMAEQPMMPENEGVQPEAPETAPAATTEEMDPGSELEALRAENKELKVFQDKIRELGETYPLALAIIYDVVETGSIPVALSQNLDMEEINDLIEEARSIEYEEHRAKYQGKVKETKARMEELETNMQTSQVSAQEFMDKVNPSEEEADAFAKYYDEFLKDAVDNKMTLDHWMRAWKGFKYDGTVAELETKAIEAEENGRIAGRNEKIVTGKQNRKALAEELPEIGTGGGSAGPVKKLNYVESLNQLHDSTSPLKKLNV